MTIHEHTPDQREELPAPTSVLRWRIDRSVLEMAGEVDAVTVGAFSTALDVCNHNTTVAALDLSAVTFFSAAGVRCFVSHGWISRAHPMIIASPAVRRVLAVCEVDFLLEPHGWTGGTARVTSKAWSAELDQMAAGDGSELERRPRSQPAAPAGNAS